MSTRLLFALVCGMPLLIAGCGGGSGSSDFGNGGSDSGNAFTDIFTQDANSEPVFYGDPAPLQSDIGTLFGVANDEPMRPGDVL